MRSRTTVTSSLWQGLTGFERQHLADKDHSSHKPLEGLLTVLPCKLFNTACPSYRCLLFEWAL